jgi:hypothetical protein
MKTAAINEMVKGWFVGNFEPTLYKTNDVEVAVKYYKAGDYEDEHYHKVATEITVIADGQVEMFGKKFDKGNIVVVEPNDVTAFRAITDTITMVVKIPGANNDKYLVEK